MLHAKQPTTHEVFQFSDPIIFSVTYLKELEEELEGGLNLPTLPTTKTLMFIYSNPNRRGSFLVSYSSLHDSIEVGKWSME